MINITSFLLSFLDIFFPRTCLGCGIEASGYICTSCEKKLINEESPGKISTENINKVFIACEYERNGLIGKTIKRVKYKFSEELSGLLAYISVKNVFADIDWSEIDMLIPVPLATDRLKWRGFNQAEVVGKEIINELNKRGENLKIEVRLLKRIRSTPPQAACSSKAERLKNLQGAFEINKKLPIPNTVILFDDVYTTGTTMNECAAVLKRSGVKNVFGLVIAKKTV